MIPFFLVFCCRLFFHPYAWVGRASERGLFLLLAPLLGWFWFVGHRFGGNFSSDANRKENRFSFGQKLNGNWTILIFGYYRSPIGNDVRRNSLFVFHCLPHFTTPPFANANHGIDWELEERSTIRFASPRWAPAGTRPTELSVMALVRWDRGVISHWWCSEFLAIEWLTGGNLEIDPIVPRNVACKGYIG